MTQVGREAGARSDSTWKSLLEVEAAKRDEPDQDGEKWCDEFTPSARVPNALR